ncbi:MAG TPA: AMP-binding protein, partial [Bryobacteraceae bacterium]|nr:AMP-binding protein [Bryobacteraceae bacterium]
MSARTLYQVLEETAQKYKDLPALHQPVTEGSTRRYDSYTWGEYRQAVDEIAAGLRSLGVTKGDVVALDSETRLEFYLADLGIMANGSIAAAMYPSYPAADLIRTIEASGARAVFVEDPKTFRALKAAPVKLWILMTGEAEGALSMAALREKGRQAMAADPQLLERLRAGVQPGDHAILYLTSGATGEPKMALVTHQAVVANIDMGPEVLPMGPEDAMVAFLPSAHIAQRVVMEMLPLRCGTPVTFAESLIKLPQEMRAARPTILLAPPRMWERIYSTVCTELRKRPAVIRRLFYGALGMSLSAAEAKRQGKSVPAHVRLPLKLADKVLFQKLRARFGGRLRVAASGAAPLSKQLAEFYEAIGMPLVEGYGLTEGGVVTLNPTDRPKPGSIGKELPGVRIQIGEDGELLVQAPCMFSGYHNDPETTAEVLRDGWLHTGDIGYRDTDGYFYITGRKKELIVSSTGKKIYPSRVENLFKMEPLVSQVLLVGDRLPFLTALITLNLGVAETLKGMDAWKGKGAKEIAEAPPVTQELQKVVLRVNKQ